MSAAGGMGLILACRPRGVCTGWPPSARQTHMTWLVLTPRALPDGYDISRAGAL